MTKTEKYTIKILKTFADEYGIIGEINMNIPIAEKINKILENYNSKTYHICDQCGSTAKEVNFKEYKRIKKKFNLWGIEK